MLFFQLLSIFCLSLFQIHHWIGCGPTNFILDLKKKIWMELDRRKKNSMFHINMETTAAKHEMWTLNRYGIADLIGCAAIVMKM